VFVTDPIDQFQLLREKYVEKESGRIPLPRNAQELWAHHKYSVMARDPAECRRLGRSVARMRGHGPTGDLARTLVLLLRERPSESRLVNALEHMWGHVRDDASGADREARRAGPGPWLAAIQALATARHEPFLISSTALGELAVYLEM
jgi:uncharacterized protein YbgA (DUF1722 family)